MTNLLFDQKLRAMRRDRAFRVGPQLFLLERAFDDIYERIGLVTRRFRSALLIGCADPAWPSRLAEAVDTVVTVDPGRLFAAAAGGTEAVEDQQSFGDRQFDLCIAIGTLDTVNNLPLALANIRLALREDALFLGAMSGGDTLPLLRQAMRAADAVGGVAAPHVHPRIDPPSLCGLLSAADFKNPVVDVDRVKVAYSSFPSLLTDLRAMAGTNLLDGRSRQPLLRSAFSAAAAEFERARRDGRSVETFEILQFAAWTPQSEASPDQR